MGTIGLAFGSPTSGQGIDVSSTVSQMVAHTNSSAESNLNSTISTMDARIATHSRPPSPRN